MIREVQPLHHQIKQIVIEMDDGRVFIIEGINVESVTAYSQRPAIRASRDHDRFLVEINLFADGLFTSYYSEVDPEYMPKQIEGGE